MVHSLILLYGEQETAFTNNGYGSLGEALSCPITEELNGTYELEMEYPVYGKRFSEIQNRRIIYAKPNPTDNPQAFRIYQITKTMNNTIVVYASHISYDTSGYLVSPFTASSCSDAMNKIGSNIIKSNEQFTFWTNKVLSRTFKNETPTNVRAILGDSGTSLLTVYGGEYKFDNFAVRLYEDRGSDLGVTIRYGKNLMDLKQDENVSEVYTDIYPYWIDRETNELVALPEKTISTISGANYTKTMAVDLSSEFEEKPTADLLRAEAQNYLKMNPELGNPEISIDVSFVQLEQYKEYETLAILERVSLGDMLSVEFPEMQISTKLKVVKTVYDALKGQYTSVTIGNLKTKISDTVIAQEENTDKKIDSTKKEVQDNIKDAKDEVNDITDKKIDDAKDEVNGITDDKINDAKNDWDKRFGEETEEWKKQFNSVKNNQDTTNRNLGNLTDKMSDLELLPEQISGVKDDLSGLSGDVDDLSTDVSNLSNSFTKFQQTVSDDIQSGIADATAWITNGKGYIVGVKNSSGQWSELCILNTPNLNTATKVWRWTSGGFGYSSNGYEGPYTTAITQDGGIVADFIKTGVLTANLITTGLMAFSRLRGGILALGGANYGFGQLKLYDSSSALMGELNGNYLSINRIVLSSTGYISGGSVQSPVVSLTTTSNGVAVQVRSGKFYVENTGEVYFRSNAGGTFYGRMRSGTNITFDADQGAAVSELFTGVILDTHNRGFYVDTFRVTKSKNRVVSTKNYGTRLLACYEMASPMFGDIGSGVISEDGLCYIYLDDIFAETVSEISEYYVFLQKEGPGDLWVKKREKRYFIVEGTPNLPFSFEIKALQRDFEFERMEPDSVLEPEETLWEDGYVEEMEETRKSSLEEFEKEQMRTVETRIFEKEVEYETTE